MKKWIGFILASIVIQPALADELQWSVTKQIHPHMIPFVFQLWTSEDDKNYLCIMTHEGEKIQQLDNIINAQDKDNLRFVDLNFDGVLDFSLPKDPENLNKQYFIYDKENAIFLENKPLSRLKNPIFIQKEKTIIAQWEEENIKTSDYYQLVGHDLVLKKQEVIECDKSKYCEKIVFTNQDGILTETYREPVEDEEKQAFEQYLNHLIDRKGLCLVHIHENTLQGNRLLGAREASLCLNTLAYELIPMVYLKAQEKDRSITLQLKNVIAQYFDLIKLLTVCEEGNQCEESQEETAWFDSIRLVDNVIQKIVLKLTAERLPLEQANWTAKWEGLNEIMQG